MRTLFEMGFRNSFRPLLGQDMVTSYDQLTDQSSSGGGLPAGTVTSYDQLNQPTTTPSAPSGGGGGAGGSSTDWGKLFAQGITAAGQGYGTYSKEQTAKIQAQTAAKAGVKPVTPGAPAPSSGVSANTVYLIGGIAVVGLIAAVALRG